MHHSQLQYSALAVGLIATISLLQVRINYVNPIGEFIRIVEEEV